MASIGVMAGIAPGFASACLRDVKPAGLVASEAEALRRLRRGEKKEG